MRRRDFVSEVRPIDWETWRYTLGDDASELALLPVAQCAIFGDKCIVKSSTRGGIGEGKTAIAHHLEHSNEWRDNPNPGIQDSGRPVIHDAGRPVNEGEACLDTNGARAIDLPDLGWADKSPLLKWGGIDNTPPFQ